MIRSSHDTKSIDMKEDDIYRYLLDMEIYVWVLVQSNFARRQERNINYAPERVHIFPYPTNNLFITYALLSQRT